MLGLARATRRGPPRLPGAALLLITLALAASLVPVASGAGGYLVERAGRSAEIPSRLLARREMLDLESCAKFFGLRMSRDKKRIRLDGDRGSITLQIGRPALQVNGQPLLLTSEVDVESGRVLVPLDFVTRALPRYLDEEARHDARARAVRFDPKGGALTCERFDDRLRITLALTAGAEAPEVSSEGSRRIVTIPGLRVPERAGGCPDDDALTDLQVAPSAKGTVLTLFTGPAFGGLEVNQVPLDNALVIDVLRTVAGPAGAAAEAPAPSPPSTAAFDTVVIDPGHGGTDVGARGAAGLLEKDLVLGVARRLESELRGAGIRVVMTRDADMSVPLTERTERANREQADLFISLHANASPAGPARGAETYFLHVDATDEAARSLAALENDATGLRARGGASGDLEMLLWDMAQQQYLEESSRLADTVQRELNALLGTKDRGVKQANFLVLRAATMPAILVEVGFLSSPSEERKMATPEFQSQTAQALSRAILAFRDARRSQEAPR